MSVPDPKWIEEMRAELEREVEEWLGHEPTPSETLDVVQAAYEEMLGFPCVTQFSQDGTSIIVSQAIDYEAL